MISNDILERGAREYKTIGFCQRALKGAGEVFVSHDGGETTLRVKASPGFTAFAVGELLGVLYASSEETGSWEAEKDNLIPIITGGIAAYLEANDECFRGKLFTDLHEKALEIMKAIAEVMPSSDGGRTEALERENNMLRRRVESLEFALSAMKGCAE